ncbi:hypothetical protein Hanom_Chr05g00466581 [Helianthus anomalus]
MSPALLASLSDLCPNSPLEDSIKPWNNHHHLILCTFCVSLLVVARQLCNSGLICVKSCFLTVCNDGDKVATDGVQMSMYR